MKLLIHLLFFSLLFTQSLKAGTEVTLQLAWKHQFQFAGYYVAKEKGFYNDAGLNINIKEYDNGVEITDDVINGKADFGVGRSSLIYDKYNDKPVVMLAAIFQHSPVILLTKKRDDIKKIEDLKNKKIMLTTDQVAMASINAMLQTHKITPDMYTTQVHSFNVQDLIDGKTDVMLSYISNEPYAMQQQNIPYTIFAPKDYNFDFYSDILFTSEALVQKSPELVKKFREASLKGWRYALEHKEETIALILNKYNTQHKTKEALMYEANAIDKLANQSEAELGNIDTKRIEYITQIYSLMGLIKNQKNINGLVYKVESPFKKHTLNFTQEEKKYLESNPELLVGGEMDWAPFDFVDEKGNYLGISKDILDLVAEKTGLKLKYQTGQTWKELVDDFKKSKLDILPAIYKNKEREDYTLFSNPYFTIKDYAFVRSDDNSINSINDLKSKSVAVIDGYAIEDNLIREFPNIKLIKVKSKSEGIDAVLLNHADVYIDGYAIVMYTISSNFISGIKPVIPINFYSNDLHLGVTKSKPILASIINKGLDSITTLEKNNILNKWLLSEKQQSNINNSANPLELSKKEEEWLKKKIPVHYVYDPDWAPFEWKNELDQHTGIIADIINLVAERSGINFESLPIDSWIEAMKKAENRDADMYSAINESEETSKYMDFTKKNLFEIPFAFVTRANDQSDYYNVFDALAGKKIAVVEGYPIQEMISQDRPDLHLETVKNMTEGFKKLRNGEIDVFCQDIVTAKRYINVEGFDDLRIAVKTGYTFDLKIAIRNDWPKEIVSIIDKTLDTITKKEIDDIYNKWTSVTYKETVDYSLIWKVAAGVFLIFLLFAYYNRKLKMTVNEKTIELKEVLKSLEEKVQDRTEELNEQKEFVQSLLDSQEQIVITTDGASILSVNKAFLDFYTVDSIEEFIEKYAAHCICDTFHPNAPEGYIQKFMGKESWIDYIIQRSHPDITHKVKISRDNNNHVFSVTAANLPGDEGIKSAIFTDITVLERVKQEIEDVLANILLPVVISSRINRKIMYANKAAEKQFEKPLDDLIGSPTDSVYAVKGVDTTILDTIKKYGRVDNLEKPLVTSTGKEFIGLLSINPIEYKDEEAFIAMVTDITKQKDMENEVRAIHKHTRESIEYAALIQGALIPDNSIFEHFFHDHFAIWAPKDIVGGDIYLMNKINEDELILMVIDCTGHGVPGAFVTMLVKAIERQLMANIHKDETISPAKILGIFNKSIKNLLKQESIDSVSNAGFDGGILYYNKQEKIIRFAGAETPLFIIQNDQLKVIKGDRHSIGYKKSDSNYQFTDHEIDVSIPTKLYLSTDGYLDQNGGTKGFPFGKKRFTQLVEKINEQKNNRFSEQQEILLNELSTYQQDSERNDDVTLIGLSIDSSEKIEQYITKEILNYHGVITQNFISTCMDNIEYEVTNIAMMGNISTVVIELCQNMMNYSKSKEQDCRKIEPLGFISVIKEGNDSYTIIGKNIISIDDKKTVELKLLEIKSLDKMEIRKRYRELRKSGHGKHEKGAGIALYEIAKIVNDINYDFQALNSDKYEYTLKLKIGSKQQGK